ncbi:unnamed protein product [Rotaria sp. Silwood2]|nr:unnamed protein product [Rotaria sp. Silwood2]CAF3280433.1 unnamed protein product [Rotaria sp. Silwood2]CAF3923073.1 unnamed protein product [Rotaria sp. Silwood2]CAF4351011.1 unnamed protein product [Rotaria sp. Silwood2]CAF4624394.1 unnamed protein product [Rotaria sp. Silwood2]
MPLQALDTSILPPGALSFYDDNFYNLVKNIAGTTEAKLLEIQGIRSVYSFLHTDDIFEILTIQCSALNDIKAIVCLEADDKTFIIKPGYRGNIRYLYQLLHQKHEEYLKEISSKPKRNKPSMSQQNANNFVDNSQHSIQSSSTSSRQNHATPSNNSSTTNRHDFVIHTLNEWINKQGIKYGIQKVKLIENEDFRLFINDDETDTLPSISCSCGIKVQLGIIRGSISLSNYYKHLKSKSCIIKKKISKHINGESSKIIDDESSDAETSQNNSNSKDIQCLTSVSSMNEPATISKSNKRTTDQDNNSLSKKKRI